MKGITFYATLWLQFQKHKYAKLSWFPCGKKGYGLQLREDISEGQFLIEYVGEVTFSTFVLENVGLQML